MDCVDCAAGKQRDSRNVNDPAENQSDSRNSRNRFGWQVISRMRDESQPEGL